MITPYYWLLPEACGVIPQLEEFGTCLLRCSGVDRVYSVVLRMRGPFSPRSDMKSGGMQCILLSDRMAVFRIVMNREDHMLKQSRCTYTISKGGGMGGR